MLPTITTGAVRDREIGLPREGAGRVDVGRRGRGIDDSVVVEGCRWWRGKSRCCRGHAGEVPFSPGSQSGDAGVGAVDAGIDSVGATLHARHACRRFQAAPWHAGATKRAGESKYRQSQFPNCRCLEVEEELLLLATPVVLKVLPLLDVPPLLKVPPLLEMLVKPPPIIVGGLATGMVYSVEDPPVGGPTPGTACRGRGERSWNR